MHIDHVEIGNFRKLLGVRIDFSKEKTIFVGANNSGKTSAMLALRYFLIERERKNFSFYDFTLTHWPTIDAIGKSWVAAKAAGTALPSPDWSIVAPFIDVWLHAGHAEAHFVQKIIPTLDWAGGRIGVRLRFEPREPEKLQRDFLGAREEARTVEAADQKAKATGESGSAEPLLIWPKSLTDYLQRRLAIHFTVKAYILDPTKLAAPESGIAKPQPVATDAEPIDGDPFKGLIRIDEISAQRGFGHAGEIKGPEEGDSAAGASTLRKMSEQLRRYWQRHLDPFDNPDAQDLQALRAIEEAQKAFDDRLKSGFKSAFEEVEGIGYPGVTDPRLKISTRLRPVDGLNHEAAVQYMISVLDGAAAVDLSLPEDSNGLGYQNLISMIFRLMGFRDAWMKVGKAGAKTATEEDLLVPPLHLVLLEEPEAYLHTQVQQVFVRRAYSILRKHPELQKPNNGLSTQLVVSTHSSHVAHECDFEALRYFRRLPGGSLGVPTSCVIGLGAVFGADRETQRFVTRYLKVTHSDLLFADAAVLVEGPAERILIPFFVRNHHELTVLAESYISWLEIGGSHAHRLKPLIEKLGLTTLVVGDIDAMDGQRAVPPKRGAGLQSRNATLKTWWPKVSDFDKLLDLSSEAKVKAYKPEQFSIRVAYQSPVTVMFNGTKVEALSNTLEDALVVENLEFFKNASGKGLFSTFKASIGTSTSISALAAALFEDLKKDGKAEFALDLLAIEHPEKLHPPAYIKEGLLWLASELHQNQKDLGVATAPMVAPAPAMTGVA